MGLKKIFAKRNQPMLVLVTSMVVSLALMVTSILIVLLDTNASAARGNSGGLLDGLEKPDGDYGKPYIDVKVDGEVTNDLENKKVTFQGDRYSMVVSYDKQFKVEELAVDGTNILDKERGIYMALGSVKNEKYSSLELEADPVVTVSKDQVVFEFSGEFSDDKVTVLCGKEAADIRFERTFKKNVSLYSQAFPSVNLRHNAIENIRWERSGSNFWIDGKASGLKGFLAAGSGYLAERGDSGTKPGNVHRAQEDITFTLLSSEKEHIALSMWGYVKDRDELERPFAMELQRYESGNLKPLEMNMVVSSPTANLAYVNGTEDGFPGGTTYTGRIQQQNMRIFNTIPRREGQTDTAGFVIKPQDYDDYFDLGDLKGIDEKQLAYALNNYGRMMIMDYNMGTTVENPNNFLELPSMEQHWNTAILSLLRDDEAISSQMSGLRIIRDKLQASDGHITSPFPLTQSDGWGHDYADAMPGYVIASVQVYKITGDKAFLEEMRASLELAMQAQYDRYLDTEKYIVRNANPDLELKSSGNDYWEKSRGEYNGYTTGMYYEALTELAQAERYVFKDEGKAAEYEELAAKILAGFNANFWSEQSDSYLYGTANEDVRYLPVQSTALKNGMVLKDRVTLLVQSIERENAVFNLPFHVMNVRNLLDITSSAPQSPDPYLSMLGENGGWYGAPDGEFYSALPQYGDRTLIPRYINQFAKRFEETGFINASTYMRDGVTPASYDWHSCMPTLVHPIWGLYTYGYGFQPEIDRLNIAPFIEESMVGSIVKYRWRGANLAVTYESLYQFTLETEQLPADAYFCFINQTPDKDYTVVLNGKEQTVRADSSGTVAIKVNGKGKTTAQLKNPDSETLDNVSTNIAYKKPVSASSAYNSHDSTANWPDKLSDGSYDSGFWTPEENDRFPWIRLDLGRATTVGTIKMYVVDEDVYRYKIEGTNDPNLNNWETLVDRTADGRNAKLQEPLEETVTGQYHYIRVSFSNTNSGKAPRLLEIEAGVVNPGAPEKFEIVEKITAKTNLALRKPVTARTWLPDGGWAKEMVVDGNRGSGAASAGYSSDVVPLDSTEWFMIDLEEVYKINRFVIAPRGDKENLGMFFPVDYRIEVSVDGNSWTTVHSVNGSEKVEQPFEVQIDPIDARYVKFVATKLRSSAETTADTARLQLAEFEVYPYIE